MLFLNKIVPISLLIIIPLIFPGCVTTSRPALPLPEQELTGSLSVHFIDVGQGDSTFIRLSSGETILVDAGSPSGGHDVVKYLKSLGVKKIDHFILTHPHDDHMGGIFSVVSGFPVKNFYDNGFSNFSSTLYGDYINIVRNNLSAYHVIQAGESIRSGDVTVDVLNPLLPPTGNQNDDSIVLKLIFGKFRILLAGDMGHPGESRLLHENTMLKSEVMKVAHHGENDVCTDDFLEAVQPEIAIISVGTGNSYGRPKPELLSRLDNAGVRIYRTDLDGTVVLRSDGKTYSIKAKNRSLSQ